MMCFAPDCKHYSERDGCSFFVFPKDQKEKERWIKLIRRHDKSPSKHHRVCSCHFKDKDRNNGPTLFLLNSGKVIDLSESPLPPKKNITQDIKTMMCFAPDCKHFSDRDSCTFYRFPKDHKEKAKWLKLLRQQDKRLSPNHKVCSCHFKDKDKNNGPSLLIHNVDRFDSYEPPKKKINAISAKLIDMEESLAFTAANNPAQISVKKELVEVNIPDVSEIIQDIKFDEYITNPSWEEDLDIKYPELHHEISLEDYLPPGKNSEQPAIENLESCILPVPCSMWDEDIKWSKLNFNINLEESIPSGKANNQPLIDNSKVCNSPVHSSSLERNLDRKYFEFHIESSLEKIMPPRESSKQLTIKTLKCYNSPTPSTSSSKDSGIKLPELHLPAMAAAQIYFLEQEVANLKSQLKKGQNAMTFKNIEINDSLISLYTGIPTKQMYMKLFELMDKYSLKYHYNFKVEKIKKIDQLLLTLMKLRLNLLFQDLAFRFKVNTCTVSNVFRTWLSALHEVLFKNLSELPTTTKKYICMPSCFSSFTKSRMVVASNEITAAKPKIIKKRVIYSFYKNKNGLKALIGIAPNGAVIFASSLYLKSVSDENIVQNCGVLEKVHSGDLILADKGSLLIDILPESDSINDSLYSSTVEFIPENLNISRTIATAMKRIKCCSILHEIPPTLKLQASTIFQLCSALINLQVLTAKEADDL